MDKLIYKINKLTRIYHMKNINLKLIKYKKELIMLPKILIILYDDQLILWLEQMSKNLVVMSQVRHMEPEKYLPQKNKI